MSEGRAASPPSSGLRVGGAASSDEAVALSAVPASREPVLTDSLAGLSLLLEWLPLAALIIDGADEIVFANGRAGEWLGRGIRGPLAATLGREGERLFRRLLTRVRCDGDLVARDVRIANANDTVGRHDLWLSLLPASSGGGGGDGSVLVLLDHSQARELSGREAELDATRRMGEGLATALAHEIRNPLAGIRGAAQLLEARCGNREQRLTRLIRDEVDRIDRLVGRVAALSHPRREMKLHPWNIHEVIDHVVALCRAEQSAAGESEADRGMALRMADGLAARPIVFERVYDPSLPPIIGDRDALTQVLLNLVRNACEALGEVGGGRVRLITTYRHGWRRQLADGRIEHLPIEIRVADDGPGVAPSLVPHLFEAFVSGRETGRGLGLAVVGRIVRDHGGLVRYEPGHDGGAVFVINLPAAPPQRDEPPIGQGDSIS
ncbi:MAG: hypothetical protein D6757_10640 [Alphaproteobacteria bacterium]|nr:MAG: hypothetical protein D6757_10640 [Alphaproteobacteria bacterium]